MACDASTALGRALLYRCGDTHADDVLAELAAQGWHLVNIPSIEKAADAIRHQRWDCEPHTREERDAAAVLELLRHVA